MGWVLLLVVGRLLLLLLMVLLLGWRFLFKIEKVGMEIGQVRDEILKGIAVVVGIVPDEIGQTREVTVGGSVLLECGRQIGELVLRFLLEVHNVAKVVQVWGWRCWVATIVSATSRGTSRTISASVRSRLILLRLLLLLLLLGRAGTLALDGRIGQGLHRYVGADLLRLGVGRRRRKLELLNDLHRELGKVFRSVVL